MRSESSALSGLRIVSAFGDRRPVGPPSRLRAFGVPPGGPFDRFAAQLARALVGLPEDEAVLEIALGPVVFEATEPLSLAVVGGPDGAFPMAVGERLEVRPENARAYVAVGTHGVLRRLADPPRPGDAPIRVVAGPQAELVPSLVGEYRVGLAANRVGVRLEGRATPHALSLPSEPAIPGAIQLPPNGGPIILGPDGPTIGGYPKGAVVIDADLDRVGRLRPGDTVRFETVTIEAAQALGRAQRKTQARRIAEIRVGG